MSGFDQQKKAIFLWKVAASDLQVRGLAHPDPAN